MGKTEKIPVYVSILLPLLILIISNFIISLKLNENKFSFSFVVKILILNFIFFNSVKVKNHLILM